MTTKKTATTILFAGGGTGGHIYPGIAVADRWLNQHPDSQIVFVGCGREIEKKILAETEHIHETVPFESPRMIFKHPLRFYRNWRTSQQLAQKYLAQYQPSVIIGLGGFASYPIVREAARLAIPILLLEQNVPPGRATNYLSKFASTICLTYDQTRHYLSTKASKKKIITTGNPVRQEIIDIANQNKTRKETHSNKPVLLIQGGSQGSNTINHAMLNYLERYGNSLSSWKVRHQTGLPTESETANQLLSKYQSASIDTDVRPYFSSAHELYQSVNFSISRAGGTTLAELHTLQIPTIIIPISNSIKNHQYKNAIEHGKLHRSYIVQETQRDFQNRFNQKLLSLLNQRKKGISESNLATVLPSEKSATILVIEQINRLLSVKT